MYGLRFIRPVRLACTPRGAVATWLAVLTAACLARMATIPRRTRTGTACPGMLMINSPQKGISVSLRLWLDH